MGAHHAACGAAAWTVIASDVAVPVDNIDGLPGWMPDVIPVGANLIDVGPEGLLAGIIVCAGAALLPDADHPQASIAWSLPPVSKWLTSWVGRISGGHRHGTHSLAGVAVFTILAAVVAQATWTTSNDRTLQVGAAAMTLILAAFAVKALRIVPRKAKRSPWATAIVLAGLVMVWFPDGTWWFPLAVAVGCGAHIVGDALTTGGVNLFWPVCFKPPATVADAPLVGSMWQPNGFMGMPILGNAGSAREWALLLPVSAVAVAGLAAATLGIIGQLAA